MEFSTISEDDIEFYRAYDTILLWVLKCEEDQEYKNLNLDNYNNWKNIIKSYNSFSQYINKQDIKILEFQIKNKLDISDLKICDSILNDSNALKLCSIIKVKNEKYNYDANLFNSKKVLDNGYHFFDNVDFITKIKVQCIHPSEINHIVLCMKVYLKQTKNDHKNDVCLYLPILRIRSNDNIYYLNRDKNPFIIPRDIELGIYVDYDYCCCSPFSNFDKKCVQMIEEHSLIVNSEITKSKNFNINSV